MKKIAIIGLGSFGFNLVKTLAERNIEIIAIDICEDRVNDVKDIATQAITMQATSKDNLTSVGIAEMDHVIVSTGPELEPSILIVHILRELGVASIIAKALSEDHEQILRMVGATEVYFPERDIAIKIGNKLSFGNLLDYFPIESGYVIQEIAPPDSFIGKTLAEIDLRKKYNVTVVAIRSVIPEAFQPNPGGDFLIKESDILIIFGSEEDIHKFSKKFSS
jgi:trk system potassium uptake protein TrkA